jgi:low affinity Fe/Cu permease
MRQATTHDLVINTVVLAAFVLCTIVLQVIVVTKSTIPADEVVTEIRIMRSEQASQNKVTAQRLAEIEAAISTGRARDETSRLFGE